MLPTPTNNDPKWRQPPPLPPPPMWWQQQQQPQQPPPQQHPMPAPPHSMFVPPGFVHYGHPHAALLPPTAAAAAAAAAAVAAAVTHNSQPPPPHIINAGAPQRPPPPTAKKGAAAWVGKMSPRTTDLLIRKVLAECGQVTKYSRTVDPTTGVSSTFCVVEFSNGLGAVRAAKFLNGSAVGGHNWLVKVDAALLAQGPELRREHICRLRDVYPNKSAADLENMVQEEEATAQANIKAMLDGENKAIAAAAAAAELEAAAANSSASGSAAPSGSSTAAPAAGGATAGSTSSATGDGPAAKRPKVQRPPFAVYRDAIDRVYRAIDVPPEFRGSPTAAHRFGRFNRFLAERKGALRRDLNAWLTDEPTMAAERRRLRAQLSADVRTVSESEVKRLVQYDLQDVEYYLSSSGSIVEYVSLSSRSLAERVTLVMKELAHSFREPDSNKNEAALTDSVAAGSEKEATATAAQPHPEQTLPDGEKGARGERTAATDAAEETSARLQSAATAAGAAVAKTPDDGEPAATRKTTCATTNAAAGGGGAPPVTSVEDAEAAASTTKVQLTIPLPAVAAPVGDTKGTIENVQAPEKLASLFAAAEEEGSTPDLPMDLHVAREAAERKRAEDERRMKEVIDKIKDRVPKEKTQILGFQLGWEMLRTSGVIHEKVRPWVRSKVEEIVGEADEEFSSFIVDRLNEGPPAEDFLDEVKQFFDEDAESFVLRLWKLLIFESIRLRDEEQNAQANETDGDGGVGGKGGDAAASDKCGKRKS